MSIETLKLSHWSQPSLKRQGPKMLGMCRSGVWGVCNSSGLCKALAIAMKSGSLVLLSNLQLYLLNPALCLIFFCCGGGDTAKHHHF